MSRILHLPGCLTALVLSFASCVTFAGPYVPGSAAEPFQPLSINDPGIVGWATGVHAYNPGAAGDTTFQQSNAALGAATGISTSVTNLGNGGSITLTFARAIVDGPGADFAVFENGFFGPGGALFAELAWVEVSSNASTFARFPGFYRFGAPAVSEFGTLDNTDFTGFAGKYQAGFGTRFDLSLFQNVPGLNINDIRYVRVVDIIGNGSVLDNTPAFVRVGNQNIPTGCPCPVYDPYAPQFNGANGYDLDGVAVLNAGAIVTPADSSPTVVPIPFQFQLLWFFLLLAQGLRGVALRSCNTQGAMT